MKLTMQLKSRSYDIILKAGCLANLHQFTNVQGRKVFVLTDSGVPVDYAKIVAGQCQDATVYTIPQGEGSKCLKVYGQVLQAMLEFGMDRKDLLVAVGGGVVGDLGGFCARWTPPSAAKRPSTWAKRRTSSARSGSRRSCSSILTH